MQIKNEFQIELEGRDDVRDLKAWKKYLESKKVRSDIKVNFPNNFKK